MVRCWVLGSLIARPLSHAASGTVPCKAGHTQNLIYPSMHRANYLYGGWSRPWALFSDGRVKVKRWHEHPAGSGVLGLGQ